jgi:hypothetical protein
VEPALQGAHLSYTPDLLDVLQGHSHISGEQALPRAQALADGIGIGRSLSREFSDGESLAKGILTGGASSTRESRTLMVLATTVGVSRPRALAIAAVADCM